MASSSVETTESSPAVENKNVAEHTGNLQPSSSIDAVDVQKSRNKLSSSSSESASSPDSPLGDPFGTSLPGRDNDAQMDNRNLQNPVVETNLARDETPTGELPVAIPSTGEVGNNILATESPPDQVMERKPDSGYRIPSHVFTRSKSNTPVDWSVASNDSLFSIHMGNMSFTKDQFLWRMDDLGTPCESSPSGYLKFNYSGPLPPGIVDRKSKELGIGGETAGVPKEVQKLSPIEDQIQEKPVANANICHHSVENGSKAADGKSTEAEDVKKVFSLTESNSEVHEKQIAAAHISRMSGESNNSTKSFAFPILEGVDKGTSISIASSPKIGTDAPRTHSQTVNTPKKTDEQSELNSPTANQSQTGNTWFSCFSCSSCCR